MANEVLAGATALKKLSLSQIQGLYQKLDSMSGPLFSSLLAKLNDSPAFIEALLSSISTNMELAEAKGDSRGLVVFGCCFWICFHASYKHILEPTHALTPARHRRSYSILGFEQVWTV